MADDWVQIERTVRRMPVEVDRNRRNRDVREHQRDDDITPPRKNQDA
jgi:hypothetical protein